MKSGCLIACLSMGLWVHDAGGAVAIDETSRDREETRTVVFDIPKMAAKDALMRFAQQTATPLLVSFDLVATIDANALTGEFTLADGLHRLLVGTGLVGTIEGGVIGVHPNPAPIEATMQGEEPMTDDLGLRLKRLGTALIAALTAPLVSAQSADATEDDRRIETIIVTAERREEDLLDVPITMTAYDDRMIDELGMANNADLETLVPGLQMAETGYKNGATIRGMQSKRANETHQDLAVATYVDGVYTADAYGAALNLFDLERVEVGRGPQGTLNGRNSVAGSVSYVTKKPTDTWDILLLTEFTDQSTQRYNAAFGGPLNESFSFRLTGGYFGGDGAQENVGRGDDYDAPDQYVLAGALRFKNERVDANLRLQQSGDKGAPPVHVSLTDQPRDDPNTNFAWYQYHVPVPSIRNCAPITRDEFIPEKCDDRRTRSWRIAPAIATAMPTGSRPR